MKSLVASFFATTTRLFRPAAAALLFALVAIAPAHASTYAFRSDTYSWESTANTIASTDWDGSCTDYPVDDDQTTLNFTGGFTFTFAGTAYSSVRVLSNGMLQFGTDDGFQRTYINTAMPAAAPGNYSRRCANATPTNVLMGYWMDLKPASKYGGGGTVTWQQKGTAPNRYFVVSWNSVYQYNTTVPYTFQIILFENGEFKYQYNSANTTGSNATIGVQVSSSDYTQYAYNTGYASAGTAIRWYIPSNTPQLVAEYRMDETSWNGTVGEVQDNSTNGHDGVRVGTAQTVANGKVCRGESVPANTSATTIDGVDTQLDVNSGIGPQTGSLDFWYRGSAAWNNGSATMLVDATTQSSRPFYLQVDGTGVLRLVVSDPGGNTASVSSPAQKFAANTWVHVGAVWNVQAGSNKTQLRLYVNGAQVASSSSTIAGTLDYSIGSLLIGDNRTSGVLGTGATGNSANGTIDEVRVYNYDIGTTGVATDMAATHSCPSSLDHLELRGSASGLTCTPTTFSLVACQDSACSTPYTGGVTGSMTPATGSAVWQGGSAFSIPSGSSSVNVSLQLTTASTVTLGVSGLAPSNNGTNLCTLSGAASCSYTASDSGLLISVPAHAAESSASMTVSAVKKADNSTACTPAFASVSKPVSFSCAYVNPATGTLPLRVAGTALNTAGSAAAACDGSSKSVTLAFNVSGVATTTLQYADVGRMQINGSYSGSGNDAGLTMSGNTQFVVAPASFAVTGPSGKQRAGIAFSASVTARNGAGNTTPNFGRESPAEGVNLAFALYQPAAGSKGGFSGTLGAFSNGTASGSNFIWTEVGTGDITATLASAPPSGTGYLASGLSATGSTSAGGTSGAVGPFVPHHFVTTVTPKCIAGGTPFTYFDQPFAYTVQAMNGLSTPTATTNYDGSFSFTVSGASRTVAQPVTLSDAAALGGSFSPSATVPASAFSGGSASGSVAYGGFATKLNGPGTLKLRATEPVDSVGSSGYTEGSTEERSGRLRLFNAFGSEKSSLAITLQAEYWNGAAWVINAADSCTTLTSASVALSNVRSNTGGAGVWTTSFSPASVTLVAGTTSGLSAAAQPKLAAPTPAGYTGSVDVALDLGSTATDQSCLATHPAVIGAGLAWLRSQSGSCASTWDRDPSARASFGIYSPESKKTVHAREIF
jgi:MSHA biogenesis protein MshQ